MIVSKTSTAGLTEFTRRQAMCAIGSVAGAALSFSDSPTQASQQPCPRLRRGVGVHHLLNWPDVRQEGDVLRYVWPPFATPSYQMSGSEVSAVRRAGFDFVRLTVDPSIFILATDQQRPELEQHACNIVAQFIDADLDVVFDLHPVEVNPRFGPGPLVDANAPDIFSAYVKMVRRIANMLKRFPPNRVALELFNEPWIGSLSEARRWDGMLALLHQQARRADPQRPLIVNGLQWDSEQGLQILNIEPFRSSNVIYTFHYYDPHAFTHQGVAEDTAWLRGLKWPIDADNARSTLDDALFRIDRSGRLNADAKAQAKAETRDYVDQLVQKQLGVAQINEDITSVARWASANNIPAQRILLGEFGCSNSAASRVNENDRLMWLRTVRVASEDAGFGWAYWAYKGYGGMQLVRSNGSLDPQTLSALGLVLSDNAHP